MYLLLFITISTYLLLFLLIYYYFYLFITISTYLEKVLTNKSFRIRKGKTLQIITQHSSKILENIRK